MVEEVKKTEKELVKTRDNKVERDEKGRVLPGSTANPDGRPKDSFSLTAMMKKALEEIVKDSEGDKKARAQILIDMIMEKAITGKDFATIWNIINRIEGFPRQAIGIGAEEGVDITFKLAGKNGKGNPNNGNISEKPPGVSTEEPSGGD